MEIEMDKDYNLIVGLRIREVRENMRMTREKFSELCNISDSFLAAVESGKKGITAKTLYKICKATNVSADYFVNGNDHGFEVDAVCEMITTMDTSVRGHLLNIIREYTEAIQKRK